MSPIERVIESYEEQLATSLYNEWRYGREIENPVKMGKQQAIDGVEVWKKHTLNLQEELRLLKEYAKEIEK